MMPIVTPGSTFAELENMISTYKRKLL